MGPRGSLFVEPTLKIDLKGKSKCNEDDALGLPANLENTPPFAVEKRRTGIWNGGKKRKRVKR